MTIESAAYLLSQIEAIDTKLTDLIDNPQQVMSYSAGGKSVSRYQYAQFLLTLRETYCKRLAEFGYATEDISSVHVDINEFGTDRTIFVGEEEE